MYYKLFGPFEVPRGNNKLIFVNKQRINEFWQKIDDEVEDLSQANGCYTFSVKSSGGSRAKPWYVGQTSKTFKGRCLSQKIANEFNYLLSGPDRKGRPELYLIARMTSSGKKFSRNKNAKHEQLETLLIQMAYSANPYLLNHQIRKLFENLKVEGMINPGKGKLPKSARSFRKLLRID